MVFGDTLFDQLPPLEGTLDGYIAVTETDNPKQFGIVTKGEKYIAKLVEKPDLPPPQLAIVGIYYLNNFALFTKALKYILDKGIKTKGEFQITDALQHMINKGALLDTFLVKRWLDCGMPYTLLESNRELLKAFYGTEQFIDETATVEGSTIGKNVSIGPRCVIKNSTLEDCIVDEACLVEDCALHGSLLGKYVTLRKFSGKAYLGDFSYYEGQ